MPSTAPDLQRRRPPQQMHRCGPCNGSTSFAHNPASTRRCFFFSHRGQASRGRLHYATRPSEFPAEEWLHVPEQVINSPTTAPSAVPTVAPTATSTKAPTAIPTAAPTAPPTAAQVGSIFLALRFWQAIYIALKYPKSSSALHMNWGAAVKPPCQDVAASPRRAR